MKVFLGRFVVEYLEFSYWHARRGMGLEFGIWNWDNIVGRDDGSGMFVRVWETNYLPLIYMISFFFLFGSACISWLSVFISRGYI